MKKRFKLIDSAFAHCNYSNNPMPPLQECPYFEWDRTGTLLGSDLLFITDKNIPSPNVLALQNKKIAWLLECRAIYPMLYEWIEVYHHLYTHVFTHDKLLLSKIPNGLWVPFGGCWVHESDWSIYRDKSKAISMMLSEKTFLEGHRLRHELKTALEDRVDMFGRSYRPIEHKIDALRDYTFQIVIENYRAPGYFTEKLIDCFVTGTIPIYWGDPKIGDVFDRSGIIAVETLNDIVSIVDNFISLNPSDYRTGAEINFEIAHEYVLSENYFYKRYQNIFDM